MLGSGDVNQDPQLATGERTGDFCIGHLDPGKGVLPCICPCLPCIDPLFYPAWDPPLTLHSTVDCIALPSRGITSLAWIDLYEVYNMRIETKNSLESICSYLVRWSLG